MALPSWTKRYQTQEIVNNVTAPRMPQGNPNGNPNGAEKPWDYKTATTDMQGMQAPAGANGFDPMGRPNFGSGITGTLKRYYWQLMGSPQSGIGADNWNAIVDDYKKLENKNFGFATNLSANDQALYKDINKRTVAGLFGAESGMTPITEGDKSKLDALNAQIDARKKQLEEQIKSSGGSINPQSLQSAVTNDQQYKDLLKQRNDAAATNVQKASTVNFAGQNISLLSPFVRATQVGLTALMDVLQEPAQKFKQIEGVNQAIADNTEGAIKTRNNYVNFFLSLTPVTAFNTAKFLLAPTSWEEKKQIVKEGWNEGRLLYSEIWDDAIRQEYKSRAKAGEDPEMLAMELQNPWADMTGTLIFDPLNLVGFVEKAIKGVGVIDEAADVVKASGLADDAKFLNNVETLGKVSSEGDAVRALDELNKNVGEYFYGSEAIAGKGDFTLKNQGELKIFNPQDYKAVSLNAQGNQIKSIKKMGNVFTWIVSSLSKDGRGLDDVNDAVTALVKLSSADVLERADAISALTHMPSPMTYFGESFLETSQMLRSMLQDTNGALDVDSLLNKLKIENGDWEAYGNKLKKLMNDAAKSQYPTVQEMQEASDLAKKATAVGNKVPAKTAKLAEQFKQLEKAHPGVLKLAAFDEMIKKPVNAINGFLSNFYFSINYGFATRNYLQNFIVVARDAGPKAWFRDGRWLSDSFIDEQLNAWHSGGMLPPSVSDYKPMTSALGSDGKGFFGIIPEKYTATNLSAKFEQSASKRVYYKFFKDTMESVLQPGRALPALEEFKTAGFTEKQVKSFVSMVQSNYGDVNKAMEEFNKAYSTGGPDMWKLVDHLIDPDAYKGLSEAGIMDEIIAFTKRDNVGKEDIAGFIDGLMSEQKNRAMAIVDDPVGMSKDNTFLRERADLAAASEKYTSVETQSYLDQLFERSTQTRDAYVKALQEMRNKTGDPQLSQFLDSLMMREPDERIRRVVQGINSNARATIDAAYKKGADLQALWRKLGAEGKFSGMTANEFRSAAWDYVLKERVPQEWNAHFGAVFAESEKYAQKYGMTELFQQAQQMNQEAQNWRTAVYRGTSSYNVNLIEAEIGTTQQANNVRAIANGYDIPSVVGTFDAGQGANQDKKLLNIINKYVNPDVAQVDAAVTTAEAIKVPRSELTPHVSDRIAQEAKRLASELSGGQVEKAVHGGRVGSSNPDWYKELYAQGVQKPAIDNALNKIIEDHGKDKGVNVERLKQLIIDNFTYGDAATGTPPDLAVLKELGADDKTLQSALSNYNDITHQDVTIEEALKQAGYEQQGGYALDAGYTRLEDVPNDVAEAAFAEKTKSNNANFSSRAMKGQGDSSIQKIPPPYIEGSAPSMARMHAETAEGTLDALRQLKQKMLDSFGVKSADTYDPQMAETLMKFTKDASNKVAEARLTAQKVGEYWRDFTLLPYGETTHLDHAMTYVYPYQFWYSRSYSSWAKTLTTDPQLIAAYAKFKDGMASIHKDAPEWWKYNVTLPEFMWGLNNGNPMYINLEATLWPLYGLTGVDFNDPKKRKDWLSSTVDDMGKFGPSLWAPINLAVAAGLSLKGETDAASRWAGRLIPQTATLKAIMAEMGQTPIELDPAVIAFGGDGTHSLDPYERSRVGRALAQMVTDGVISEEQAIEVARTQKGDLWDQAVTRATALRAPGQIASLFLGVGFKARTNEDVQIDNFYADYFKMQQLFHGGMMSPEQYKDQFNTLREKYSTNGTSFMDIVLLSRRAGEDRESAYAYNVISRIPPGMAKEIYTKLGIDPETASKFYDSGGKFDGWNEQEKAKFMTAMVDAGAMLAIPTNANRREWTDVKGRYNAMMDTLPAQFGPDIQDKIDLYFNLDGKEANLYMEAHPEISDALQYQNAMIVSDPMLMKYYGGLDKLERYYKGAMYDKLTTKYGDDIMKIEAQYFDLDPKLQKQYLKENPQLKEYWTEKDKIKFENLKHIVEFGATMPDAPQIDIYGTPQNPTQQGLQNLATPPQSMSFGEWKQALGGPLTSLVVDYYNGKDLPKYAKKNLDYLAKDYGYASRDDLLQEVLISYQSGN